MAKIITTYEPVFWIPAGQTGGQGYTFLKVTLITGRPHQIRAHLASIGHPLAGDAKYGNQQVNQEARKRFGVRRQMLHCFQTEFPKLPEPLAYLSKKSFHAPLPDDFKRFLGTERTKALGKEHGFT